MKKIALMLALAAIGSHAVAQDSPWQIGARVVNVSPANKSDPVGGAGAADRIAVASKTIPELDIDYFFTPNISAELILTYPQKHDVTLDGVNIGSFKELPPTLTAKYHFTPGASFNPYLGAGLNYTRISNVSLLNGAGDLDASSIGLALQAGVDFKLDAHWNLNIDAKKVQIRSDVKAAGAKISNVQVDPWLLAVGVNYRF